MIALPYEILNVMSHRLLKKTKTTTKTLFVSLKFSQQFKSTTHVYEGHNIFGEESLHSEILLNLV